MDGEAWRAVVHEVAESRTWLSDWTEVTPYWKVSNIGYVNFHLD